MKLKPIKPVPKGNQSPLVAVLVIAILCTLIAGAPFGLMHGRHAATGGPNSDHGLGGPGEPDPSPELTEDQPLEPSSLAAGEPPLTPELPAQQRAIDSPPDPDARSAAALYEIEQFPGGFDLEWHTDGNSLENPGTRGWAYAYDVYFDLHPSVGSPGRDGLIACWKALTLTQGQHGGQA